MSCEALMLSIWMGPDFGKSAKSVELPAPVTGREILATILAVLSTVISGGGLYSKIPFVACLIAVSRMSEIGSIVSWRAICSLEVDPSLTLIGAAACCCTTCKVCDDDASSEAFDGLWEEGDWGGSSTSTRAEKLRTSPARLLAH